MINTQKGETMDNKESSVYRCESCNGIMEYDVETKQMKCPNCGNCVPILNDTSKIIEHKLTIDAKRILRPSEKTSTTMECTGCGATLEIGKMIRLPYVLTVVPPMYWHRSSWMLSYPMASFLLIWT